MNSLQLPDHARQCFRGCFFDRESVSVLFAVLGLSLYHRYKNSWFWRDCTGRLENEPLGFQMAVLGAKMAFGFRAKNPETKADRCLPKLWGWQKGSHISPCQTTRLVIALSHAGGGEMPAKDGVAPALAKRSCASWVEARKQSKRKQALFAIKSISLSNSSVNTRQGLSKMIYLIF